jgi:hypothetical protein
MNVVEPDKVHSGGSLSLVIYDSKTQELLPASVGNDGVVMSEWELTEEEQERLFSGGRLRLWLRLPIIVTKGVIPINIEALEPTT